MNQPRGFIGILALIFVAVMLIGGSAFVYQQTKLTIQPEMATSTTQSIACADLDALSRFVFENIEKPDKQNSLRDTQALENIYVSKRVLWRRERGEPFVSYPAISGTRAFYGETGQSHDAIVATIKRNSDTIGKAIDEESLKLNLSFDSLNTLPFQNFPNRDVYLRSFGLTKGSDLYSIVLKVEGGGHQAPPWGIVTVLCGRAEPLYDKVYDLLGVKADSTVEDLYDDDYVAIADVSADKSVYAVLGSSNHVKIADYYYFDGSTLRVVSRDSYPAHCAVLESQKVGEGMRCSEGPPNYTQRQVTYSGTQVGPIGVSLPSNCKIAGTKGDVDPSSKNPANPSGFVLATNEWLIDCGPSSNNAARATLGPVLEDQGWKSCGSQTAVGRWWKTGILTIVAESAGQAYPFRIAQQDGVASCQ